MTFSIKPGWMHQGKSDDKKACLEALKSNDYIAESN